MVSDTAQQTRLDVGSAFGSQQDKLIDQRGQLVEVDPLEEAALRVVIWLAVGCFLSTQIGSWLPDDLVCDSLHFVVRKCDLSQCGGYLSDQLFRPVEVAQSGPVQHQR